MSLPRTKEIQAEPPMPSVAELRSRLGPQLSDEELLLRATMPANLVDAMQAAGPAPREYDPAVRPVLRLVRELCARRDLREIIVEKPGFRLRLGSLA
jgi:oxaloacetate decarboxylase alpha subunit